MQSYLKYGIVIILTSYVFLFLGYLSIFSLIPLIVGNGISLYGLFKLNQKLAIIHILFVIGIFSPVLFGSVMVGLSPELWYYIFTLPVSNTIVVFFLTTKTMSQLKT